MRVNDSLATTIDGAMKSGIRKIPRRLIVRSGRLLGLVLYSVAIPYRRLVQRNVQFCYPEWSRREVVDLSRRVFMSFGITFVEMVQSTFMSPEEVFKVCRVEGEENFINGFKSKQGIVIVSAHMGNWEVGLHFTSHYGKPMLGVAARIRNGRTNILLNRWRNRLSSTIINKKGALPNITEGLRRGEVVGMLIDQSRRKHGVEVTFFGRKATASPAAALLALRCRSLVLPAFSVRKPDGQLTIQVKRPIEMTRTGDLRRDIQSNTQRMIDVVEQMVRTYPDQWFWLLKPWKVHYPDLYSDWDAQRHRRKAKKKIKVLSK
jgi:KDO2-lipid IV(A) lauroyltransferase